MYLIKKFRRGFSSVFRGGDEKEGLDAILMIVREAKSILMLIC